MMVSDTWICLSLKSGNSLLPTSFTILQSWLMILAMFLDTETEQLPKVT